MSENNFVSTANNESFIQRILYNPVFRVCSVVVLLVFVFPDGIFGIFDEIVGVIALLALIIFYVLNPRTRPTGSRTGIGTTEPEENQVKKCPLCMGTAFVNGICQVCGTKVK